ncbi:HNH endonuclease, partial [Streptococcus suis]
VIKLFTFVFKIVLKIQNGRCHHCGLPMELGEYREIFFKVPKSKGGVEEVDNMAYVNRYCQRLFIESRSKE